VRKNEDADV